MFPPTESPKTLLAYLFLIPTSSFMMLPKGSGVGFTCILLMFLSCVLLLIMNVDEKEKEKDKTLSEFQTGFFVGVILYLLSSSVYLIDLYVHGADENLNVLLPKLGAILVQLLFFGLIYMVNLDKFKPEDTREKPDLTKEWHPTKNGLFTIDTVTVGVNKNVWWMCEKGHEWEELFDKRLEGTYCPVCSEMQAEQKEDAELVNE